MGRGTAQDLAYLSATGMFELETVLVVHLQSNHYPPVTIRMVEPCKQAIEAANNGNDDDLIDLPDGITYKGNTKAPAWAIIEEHHLDAFIERIDE